MCLDWTDSYLFDDAFPFLIFSLCSLSYSSVHIIANIRWRPCDGRGLPHPSPSENWYQSPWQRWWLPGQPSCSLEPRNRYGACTQTGWHNFDGVWFCVVWMHWQTVEQMFTDPRTLTDAEMCLCQQNSWRVKGKKECSRNPCKYWFILNSYWDFDKEATLKLNTQTCIAIFVYRDNALTSNHFSGTYYKISNDKC